jgi:hypothetical protein
LKDHIVYYHNIIACKFTNCHFTNNISYMGENREDQFDAVIFTAHHFAVDNVRNILNF